MPRKQRFKPSRKPQQANQAVVSSQGVDDRRAINPDAQDIEKAAPDRDPRSDIESEPG
jgi:hypothetical protein